MREVINNMSRVRKGIGALKGKMMMFKVNKGRNKFIRFSGNIENCYSSIFTVRAMIDNAPTLLSYSYNDVLTKDVKFFPEKKPL